MSNFEKMLYTVNGIAESGKRQGIVHLLTNGDALVDNHITLGNREVVNFGSCSYLGLEFDDRILCGATEALHKYGSQFSSSRSYVSLSLYGELESLFNRMYDAHCIVTPTTTLGHLAAIPVIVGQKDAVLIDQQVHNSVQMTVAQLRARGIHTQVVRHNDFAAIEEKIIRLKDNCQKIWYMADGIYSMYGDACSMFELEYLLRKYDQFHAYIDDAHGMSCFGKHGCGYVASQLELHPKIVLAVSLAKAFATGGGVLIFKDSQWATLVKNCGGPLLFSGPLQPASLGAAVASAKIHLSSDIYQYQDKLSENISYTKKLIQRMNLPCMSLKNDSPIFFITMSFEGMTQEAISLLIDAGYFVNLGIYPAVPLKNTGVRFTITRLHTKDQISRFLHQLKDIMDKLLHKNSFSYEEIFKVMA